MDHVLHPPDCHCPPPPNGQPDEDSASSLHELTDSFMIAASHELRGPLACVSAGLEILMSPDCPHTGENQRICLETMQDGVDRLTHVTHRLLEASSATLGRARMRLERVDMAKLLRELEPALRESLAQRTQSLTLVIEAGLSPVRGDRKHLEQIAEELVANASLYSDPGSEVRVGLTSGEGSTIRLVVEDEGIGIGPEDAVLVFTPFFRGDAARRMTPRGLGLSLAAARAILRQLGGCITFESVPGRGSTFLVEVPIDKEEHEEECGWS
jgi:signal transduction histidine kinase